MNAALASGVMAAHPAFLFAACLAPNSFRYSSLPGSVSPLYLL